MSGHFGLRRQSSDSSSSSAADFKHKAASRNKRAHAPATKKRPPYSEHDVVVVHESIDTSASSEVSGSLKTVLTKKSTSRLPFYSPPCKELQVVRRVYKRPDRAPPPSPPPKPATAVKYKDIVPPPDSKDSSSTSLSSCSSSSSQNSASLPAFSPRPSEEGDQETTPTPVPPRTSTIARPRSLSSSTSMSSHGSWRAKLIDREKRATLHAPVKPSPTSSTPSSGIAISWDMPRSVDSGYLVPAEYAEAAREERIPVTNLEPLFSQEGLQVARCFAALRYRKDVIEEFRCRLFVSGEEPVYKMDNLTDGKSRLLIPDLFLGPTTSPTAIDVFAHYAWPSGDRQLQDMKHVCGVMCTFRNLREPVYFATPDTDQQMFADCFTVVRRVAIERDMKRRQNFGDRNRTWGKHTAPPSPSYVAKGYHKDPSSLSVHDRMSSDFAQALDRCSRKLATSRAIQKYWVREMEVFVIFWYERREGHGKYKHDKLQVYINPYKPDIVVADKKGNALSDVLDLTTFCCSRTQLGNLDKLPPSIKRYSRAPHICFIECLNHDKRMYFSFLTSEDLKDFAQIVATLGHMQTSRIL